MHGCPVAHVGAHLPLGLDEEIFLPIVVCIGHHDLCLLLLFPFNDWPPRFFSRMWFVHGCSVAHVAAHVCASSNERTEQHVTATYFSIL